MKNIAMKLVWITTFLVFLHAVLAQTTLYQKLFMFFIIAGPVMIMYTVYRVLKDSYHTEKTFEDWYEDAPRKRENG